MSSPSHHVLVLIKGLGIGGAETMIAEAARHWDRSRFRYTVAYALPWADALVPRIESQGVEVRCLGKARRLTPSVAVRLRRLIGRESADLVHAHSPTMGVVARVVSPVPVVYTEHGIVPEYRATTRHANRLTYRRNRAVIAVSQAVADSVAAYGGPEPIVIPNGVGVAVSSEAAAAARAELGLAASDPLVVHVGNIRKGKGHDALIGAAATLARSRHDVTIVSIGAETHSGDLERLRRAADATGAGDRVRFLGRRVDALAFVGAADVYAHPSAGEAFGLAVLEAMALGRPVVATAVGGVIEMIKDGETGVLVRPGDPDALAAGIQRLLEDREYAARLGAAAHRLARERHGIEPMVRAIEGVYEEVLGR